MFITNINSLRVLLRIQLYFVEVNRLNHIRITNRRVLYVKHSNHPFTEDCILLWCNKKELDSEHLFFAKLRDVDLDLQIHKSSSLGNFRETEFAVFSILILVVTPHHR